MARIDLNSDLGESFGAWTMGDDAAMLEIVTSANVACGFHAGDPTGILQTLREAARRGVSIGAHVAYPDLSGFGRRNMDVASADLRAGVIYQIGALQALARVAGTQVSYVKPHGALYNTIAHDRGYTPEGTLVSRREPGAVLHDAEQVAARMLRLVREGVVEAVDGSLAKVEADSICVHGDSPDAVAMARAVRRVLADAGVTLAPFA